MPIFECVCKECRHEFEALLYGTEEAECPKCHGAKLDARLSVFAVSSKAATTARRSVGGCGSCGEPRGPGACSLGDMD